MRLDLRILGLPASILFLLASRTISTNAAQDEESPAQLQRDLPIQKRLPPDSPQRRRQLEAVEEHLRLGRSPVGVLKMSSDEGEKFYMDYWQFEGELEQSQLLNTGISLRARDEEEEARLLANSSATVSFRPPFALHTEEWSDTLGFEDLRARSVVDDRSSAAVLAMLTKRGFQCPTGTANCTDAGFPNSCCPTTEYCYPIQELVKVIFLQNCCISLTYESGELVSCFETSLGSLALMSAAKHIQSSQLPRTPLDFAVLISWIVRG